MCVLTNGPLFLIGAYDRTCTTFLIQWVCPHLCKCHFVNRLVLSVSAELLCPMHASPSVATTESMLNENNTHTLCRMYTVGCMVPRTALLLLCEFFQTMPTLTYPPKKNLLHISAHAQSIRANRCVHGPIPCT